MAGKKTCQFPSLSEVTVLVVPAKVIRIAAPGFDLPQNGMGLFLCNTIPLLNTFGKVISQSATGSCGLVIHKEPVHIVSKRAMIMLFDIWF